MAAKAFLELDQCRPHDLAPRDLTLCRERAGVLEAKLDSQPALQEAEVSGDALLHWQPHINVEKIEEFVSYDLGDTRMLPQQMANRYWGRVSELWDARLYITYTALSEALPKPQRTGLRREQNVWLEAREKAVREAFDRNEGGTISPLEASIEDMERTERREVVLHARLIELEDRKAAPKAPVR